ncbi:MAG: DUF1801 domain-containing protein [Phenylobacterium sp.]|uniref:DUF1801 domain-containing protein n=1 Tax=Phenylobacterium sp. TaxID=1871053 RepID=UPI0025F156F3|nr:DUF1801 domain-containing protein [Phenylobacterium sp.]MBI1198760.1 DUF1801 domain-containing protein [Phenylobacterium sp.]
MAYEAKTRPTDADVDAFLDAAQPAARRDDGRALRDLMARISGEPAVMWGPSIVGFGVSRYSYADGRPGEICKMGFSPRRPSLVLYLPASPDRHDLLGRLGKHAEGRGCLYIKRLSDVDMDVLETLLRSAWAAEASG